VDGDFRTIPGSAMSWRQRESAGTWRASRQQGWASAGLCARRRATLERFSDAPTLKSLHLALQVADHNVTLREVSKGLIAIPESWQNNGSIYEPTSHQSIPK
jgi:hypothetical protein